MSAATGLCHAWRTRHIIVADVLVLSELLNVIWVCVKTPGLR